MWITNTENTEKIFCCYQACSSILVLTYSCEPSVPPTPTRDRVELSLLEGVAMGTTIEAGRGGSEGGSPPGPHLDNSRMQSFKKNSFIYNPSQLF